MGVELNFHAYGEDEFKREFPVHEEDMNLDLQPTLFQQWMGEYNHAEESEDEEDEVPGGKRPPGRSQGVPRASHCSNLGKEKGCGEDGGMGEANALDSTGGDED